MAALVVQLRASFSLKEYSHEPVTQPTEKDLSQTAPRVVLAAAAPLAREAPLSPGSLLAWFL